MNTSEQITALLHGELTDDRSVAELMHILSVSPERRAAFLEHIKVSRQLLRSGRGIAPPPAATENLLARITAMELAIATPPPSESSSPSPTPAGQDAGKSNWKNRSLILLLLLSFTAAGYLLGSHNEGMRTQPNENADSRSLAASSVSQSQASTPTTPSELKGLSQESSIGQGMESSASREKEIVAEAPRPAGKKGYSGVNAAALQERIAELTELLENGRRERTVLQLEINRLHLEMTTLKGNNPPAAIPQNEAPSGLPTALQSGNVRELPLITPAEAQANSLSGGNPSLISAEGLPRPSASTAQNRNPWRVELRQHIRSSLPGVQGLDPGAGILSDREIGIATEFTAMQRPIRLGIAVGGTTFAQVYHTNTGGALNDTIIEQMPNLIYGRVYAAPRIFEGERFSSALELGVGGTQIGPVGTAGLNVEYKLADRLTIQTGLSSWLLWTSFRNQLHTSTNLNAHIGISLNP